MSENTTNPETTDTPEIKTTMVKALAWSYE